MEFLGATAARLPAATGLLRGWSGATDLQQTMPLVWLMVAISVVGSAVTWGFLVYALWKFRDPTTRGRRYG